MHRISRNFLWVIYLRIYFLCYVRTLIKHCILILISWRRSSLIRGYGFMDKVLHSDLLWLTEAYLRVCTQVKFLNFVRAYSASPSSVLVPVKIIGGQFQECSIKLVKLPKEWPTSSLQFDYMCIITPIVDIFSYYRAL